MKENFSVNERSFAIECISNGQRSDGRKLSETRSVHVAVGPSWGFAEVSFDSTQAIAATTVEAVIPSSDRPNEGILSISLELSSGSSEASARDMLHRAGTQPSFVETRTAIESFVRDSRAIDTEALCILAGVKVWAVRVAVDIINDDGNCLDVAMMAIMASLLHARRPDVTVSGRDVRVHAMNEREPVPLPVHHIPLAATFALFGAGKPYEPDTAVLDPTKLEQAASNGYVSFAFNGQGEACGVFKAGGIPLLPSTFAACAMQGVTTVRDLIAVLKQAMADAAENHPMALTRPMLVNAEPTAILPVDLVTLGDDHALNPNVPSSTWNAKPVVDAAPPIAIESKGDNITTVEENVNLVFNSEVLQKKLSMLQDNKHKSKNVDDVPAKQDVSELSSSESSESDSSADGLDSAIISRVKGKR